MDKDFLLTLLFAFFNSFQFKAILGLIFLDVVLGIAQAIRQKMFSPSLMADFYLSNILPYVIGYGALYVGIYVILPKEFGFLPDTLVTLAWSTLVTALLGSILKNLASLYPPAEGLANRLNV